MKEIPKSLLKLNNLLYNLPAHAVILIGWVTALIFGGTFLKLWISSGLVIWAGLWVYRFYKEKNPGNYGTQLKDSYKRDGILPFLVGLNLGAVLGALLLTMIVSIQGKKHKKDPTSSDSKL